MPRKRALIVLAWVGNHARIILTGMLLALIGLTIWNVTLYRDLNATRSSLSGIEIARIVEARAADRNQVTQCRAAIPFIKSFQTLTEAVRANLIARGEKDQARNLIDLPSRNQKFCDDLARDLRAALVKKYGDKLAQLEREEGASRREDT